MTELGAPSQEEITAFQMKSNDAQMKAVRANAAVAEAQEQLAYRQAEASAAQTDLAKLNIEATLMQQRINFAQQAAKSPIVKAPPIQGLRR